MVYTKFEKFSAQAVCLAIFHPKRPWILISFESGLIELWDYLMNQKLMSFNEHVGPVFGLAFHPTLPMFASGGHDQKVRLWNTDTGALIHTFVGHQDYVTVVDFHSEQPWLLSGSDDQTIKIWNWQSRSRLADLLGHTNYVTSAAFHATSDLVASSSLDHTLRVWDLSKLKTKTAGGIQKIAMQVLTLPMTVITKHSLGQLHSRPINDMIWTNNTMFSLATASDDGTVRLWKYTPGDSDNPGILTGQASLTGFDQYPVIAVNINAKGMLVAGNSNGLLKFYDMETRAYIDSINIPPPLPPNGITQQSQQQQQQQQGQQGQQGQQMQGQGQQSSFNSGAVSTTDSKFEFFSTHPTQDLMALIYTTGIKIITTQRERPAAIQGRDGKSIYYINDNKLCVKALGDTMTVLGTLRKEIAGQNAFGAGRLALKPSGLQVSDEKTFPAIVSYYDGVNHTAVCIDPSREESSRSKKGIISTKTAFSPMACSPAVQVMVPPVLCNDLVAVLGTSRDYISVWDAKQFGWVEDNKASSKIVIDPGAITLLAGGYNRVLIVYSTKLQLLDIVEKKVVATCMNNLNQPSAEGNFREGCSIKYSVVGNRIHPMYTGDDIEAKEIPRQLWPYYIAVLSSHRVDILKVSPKVDPENSHVFQTTMVQTSHVVLKSRVKGGVWSQLIRNKEFFSAVEKIADIDKGLYNEIPKTVFIFSTLTHICYISPAFQSKSCSGVLTSINRTLYPAVLNEEASKFWYVEKSGLPKVIPLEGSLGVLGEGIRIARRACTWMVNKTNEKNDEQNSIIFKSLVAELAKIVRRTTISHLGMSPVVYLMSMNPPAQQIAEAYIEQMCSSGNGGMSLDNILLLITYPSLEFLKVLYTDEYLALATSAASLDRLKVITASVCLKAAKEGKLKTSIEILWKSLDTGYNDELLRSCLAVFSMAGWRQGLEYLKGRGSVGLMASLLLESNCVTDLEKCGYSNLAKWISSNKGNGKDKSLIEFKELSEITDSESVNEKTNMVLLLETLVGLIVSGRETNNEIVNEIKSLIAESKSNSASASKKKTWVMMEEDEEGDWDIEDDNDVDSSSEDEKAKKKGKGKNKHRNTNDSDESDNRDNSNSEGWDENNENDEETDEENSSLQKYNKKGNKGKNQKSEDDESSKEFVDKRIKKFIAPKHNLPPWTQWKSNGHPYMTLVINFYKTGKFDEFFNNFEDIITLLKSGEKNKASAMLEEYGVSLSGAKKTKKSKKDSITLSDLCSTGLLAEATRLCAASIIPLSIPPFPQHVVYYPRTAIPGDASALPKPNMKDDMLEEKMRSIKQLVTKGKVHSALSELRVLISNIMFAEGDDEKLNNLLREAGHYCCGIYSDIQRRKLKDQNADKEGIENHIEELRLHFVFPFYDMDSDHEILALRQGITAFTKNSLNGPASLLAKIVVALAKNGAKVEKKALDRMKKIADLEPEEGEQTLFDGTEFNLEKFNIDDFTLDTYQLSREHSYCPVCNASFSVNNLGAECPCCTCGVLCSGKRKLYEVSDMSFKE